MKKLIFLPALGLAVLMVFAYGKSGETSSLHSAVSRKPESTNKKPTDPATSHPSAVAAECYQKGGIYSSDLDICKIDETTHFGWEVRMGTFSTNIVVPYNAIVTVKAKGSPRIHVGDSDYPAGASFIAKSEGLLVMDGESQFKSYEPRTVRVTYCFGPNGYGYSCRI